LPIVDQARFLPTMLVFLLLQTSTAAPAIALVGTFRSPRMIESSGVAVSHAHPGILWTHNDSGDGPYVYATDLRGTDRGVMRVSGARAVDWEDIALGPCPLTPGDCLYIGDTGDNLERRSSVRLYVVPEPDPPVAPADSQRVTSAARGLSLSYPDGPHDVEALFVSPRDTAVYLVSKGRSGRIRLYRVPRTAWAGTRPVTAQLVQTLPIVPDRTTGRLVTGAGVRADGGLVAIRTYTEIYFFTPNRSGQLALSGPTCSVAGAERLGEAVDFWDDTTLVLTSEADPLGPGTIHTARCPR
jgi:hypothetical protein